MSPTYKASEFSAAISVNTTPCTVLTSIYKGLDVVTAKASPEERAAAPHHLLDILEPHQMFTVVDFRNRVLKIIDNLTGQGKIPIIVGGTNYYIESIVYKILVQDDEDSTSLLWERSRLKRLLDDDEKGSLGESEKKVAKETTEDKPVHIKKENTDDRTKSTEVNTIPIKQEKTDELSTNLEHNPTHIKQEKTCAEESQSTLKVVNIHTLKEVIDIEKFKKDIDNEKDFTNEEIHAKLRAVDPVMSTRLHPNNRRKVLR
ncbi:IPP transferase domain-containing protein [Phthorimaea operculella]|nr:IPP transferase domain-containing protein [Phthorimaea operculella]